MDKLNVVSLANVSVKSKVELLKGLGYKSDGVYVLDKDGKQHIDIYINKPVKIENMAILPGSLVIIDNNSFSLLEYLEDYKKEI